MGAINLLNQARKLRTPKISPEYISRLLGSANINANTVSIKPLNGGEGYQNFYYKITADNHIYFGSAPDSLGRVVVGVYYVVGFRGLKYKSSRDSKKKDFEDMKYLHGNGIPSTNPVAFDPKTGLVIEGFEEGVDLGSFLNNITDESIKHEKSGQSFDVLKQIQKAGRRCGEPFPSNFFVRTDGRVIVTDMETESALENPEEHELAQIIFHTSVKLGPRNTVSIASDVFPRGMIKNAPHYLPHLLSEINPATLYQTVRELKRL